MTAYEDVLPDDTFERWHQVTCRNYSVTECRPVRDSAFSAEVKVRPFGELAISRISSQVGPDVDLKVTRGHREIRRDYRDDFLIWIGGTGTTILEQSGRCVQLHAGDLSLHDQATPFSLSFGQRSAATMIIVPRHLMLDRIAQAERYAAWHVPAQSPIARLAAATALEATSCCDTTPEAVGALLWNATLDIWSSAIQAFVPVASANTSANESNRLRVAQRYLRKRLHDPDLDLPTVAAALHMSSRTLLRLFSAQGTTPMHWLWQERLRCCYEALSRGQFSRVSDAAFTHGFRNLSHFSRAFKDFHGINARQLIQEARVADE